MSYDLAVWEGAQPTSHLHALQHFHRLYDNFMNGGEFVLASTQIQSFVAKLLDRWADTNTESEADTRCPWVGRPLIRNASGPFVYFTVRKSRASEVVPYVVQLAAESGLVCFDPQTGELR
ncbi:MAG: hypothetical protein WB777_06475 [Mycobacterium sp.]